MLPSTRRSKLLPDLSRQTAEAVLDCICIVLQVPVFRACFVALSPGSLDESIFFTACNPFYAFFFFLICLVLVWFGFLFLINLGSNFGLSLDY